MISCRLNYPAVYPRELVERCRKLKRHGLSTVQPEILTEVMDKISLIPIVGVALSLAIVIRIEFAHSSRPSDAIVDVGCGGDGGCQQRASVGDLVM